MTKQSSEMESGEKNRPRGDPKQCDLGELDERLKMEILQQGAQPQQNRVQKWNQGKK